MEKITSKNFRDLIIKPSLLVSSKYVFCGNIEQAYEILGLFFENKDYIKHGVLIFFIYDIEERDIILHKDFAKYRELLINKNLYFFKADGKYYEESPVVMYSVGKANNLISFNYNKSSWETCPRLGELAILKMDASISKLLRL